MCMVCANKVTSNGGVIQSGPNRLRFFDCSKTCDRSHKMYRTTGKGTHPVDSTITCSECERGVTRFYHCPSCFYNLCFDCDGSDDDSSSYDYSRTWY